MSKKPRYLPDGDYKPHGWPQGTGITLSRTDRTPDDRVAVAEVLSGFGCRPDVALRAADEILNEGSYSTRVRTATALCRNLAECLQDVGVALDLEEVVPEGNYDHARMEKYRNPTRGREVRTARYPGVRAMVEEAAEAEASAAFRR